MMDAVFSTLHSSRGTASIDKTKALKHDLNLMRIKWIEMGLSFTQKFHVLFEHLPDVLLELDGFYDMGEDAIERWHQMRLKHYARVRNLRNLERQKDIQAKHQEVQNDHSTKEVINEVNTLRKRKFKIDHVSKATLNSQRKKNARTSTRERIKNEVEQDERKTLPTPRERQMNEHKARHNL